MNQISIDHNALITEFNEYIKQYGTENKQINLRIAHMRHTAQAMLDMANILGMDDYDTDMAWAIGYLHDISRLEQFKMNIRIIDFQKYNHAESGAELLFSKGIVRNLIPNIDEIPAADVKAMELAVRYHSDLNLPDDLTERERLFCNLIRDADKVDIFRVFATTSYENIYNDSYQNFVLSDFSDKVVEAFEKRKNISTDLVHSPGDLFLLNVALVFGLNFKESLELIKKQGYFEKMLDVGFVHPATQKQFESLKNIALSIIDSHG